MDGARTRIQRAWLATIWLAMGTLGQLVLCPGMAQAEEAQRPNILFIIADDASRDSMGAYGSTYVKTPNFDRIAREGMRFTQAYNCNPKCAPARACLLTGRYSWQLEEACNHNPFLPTKFAFYPKLLENAGYHVGYTGKGWGPGAIAGGNTGENNPAGRRYNTHRAKPPYTGIGKTDYAANFGAFLDTVEQDQPFCFWLGTTEPHRKYEKDSWKKAGKNLDDVVVPPYYPDNPTIRGDLADYALEVEWFDTHIGRALTLLEEQGALDNTLVIATSDHGMPFPRVKGQIYDDGFHIPMAVRWGDKIQAGRVVTDFITFPDLAPTLLEVAGIEPHPQMTGQSFLPQLVDRSVVPGTPGRVDSERDHTLLGKERHDIGRVDDGQLSVGYPSRAIRNDHYLYVRNFKPNRWPGGDPEFGLLNCDNSPTKSYLTGLSQLDEEYKYYELAFGKRPMEELYDMRSDPGCINNLADDRKFAVRRAVLWKQLKEELTAQGDPRVLGQGDIFDWYPYCHVKRQRRLYERPDWDPVKAFRAQYPE